MAKRRISLRDDVRGGLRAIATEALALAALVGVTLAVAFVVDLML